MSLPQTCDHAGWGRYPEEAGVCPPPAVMRGCAHCAECPVCGYRIAFVNSCTCSRGGQNYETAVLGIPEVR